MIWHAAGAAAVVLAVIAITLLPFLPGGYDPVAGPASMTARVFGFAGLVLVPCGLVWLAWPRRGPGIVLLAAVAVVWAVVSLAAFASGGYVLCAIAVALGVVLFARMRSAVRSAARAAGMYAAIVPLGVFVLQLLLVPRAVEFSRDRAIRNAAPLIADIERHRDSRGRYPLSMLAVWPDYKPGVIGIERYHYEASGTAYNVAFEQIARELPTREFVVYNPRDEQTFTSHAAVLLQFDPDRLQRARGYFAIRDTAHSHWKLFWFD